MKIKNKALTIMCLCAVMLCSCSSKGGEDSKPLTVSTAPETTTQTATTTSVTVTTTKQVTTTTAEPVPKGNFNNLTGLYDLSEKAEGKRPVAIMINNISVSLPQYGIYSADMMFECPVEGGITRLMAVYGDMTKVPDVCSIRSCRYYYALFAMGLDAVYLHYGIDKTVATETIEKFDTDHIDGGYNSAIFYRDPNRAGRYSREHTVAVDGQKIPDAIKNAGISTDYSKEYDKPVFDFNESAKKLSDVSCTKATINFSNSYYSTFNYDKKTKTYKKFHNGSKHIDSSNSKQLEYTNVFYLETTTKVINQNNGLISLDWKGGNGYYISNGSIVPIKWSKASETAPLVFKDADGKALKVNPGKSYIGFSNKGTLSYS